MKLKTSLVAIKRIRCAIDRAAFGEEKIEAIARLILEAEGTIRPIILRRTSLDSYEVVDGALVYHASVQARELNPLKGEVIQAIILTPENEAAVLRQIELLK